MLRESLTLLLFVYHGHDFSPLEILLCAQFTQVCQNDGTVSLSVCFFVCFLCVFFFFFNKRLMLANLPKKKQG